MGLRVGGIFFSGLFAFGSALLGYDLSSVFLAWLRLKDINPFPNTFVPALAIAIIGALVGFLIGAMLYRRMVELGQGLKRIPAEDKIASIFGTMFSLVIAFFITSFIVQQQWKEPVVTFAVSLLTTVIIVWLGNVIALSMKDEWKYLMPGMAARQALPAAAPVAPVIAVKLLDTNVIIDGRIYDICRSGFLDGQMVLPGFVLEELHHIADSADALRRNRGRRGLDILNQMQTELDNSLRIVDKYKVTFGPGDPVDMKLVKLAKAMNADVVTNDFNLNKVAKLHGVRVLNVNELANAVKPVVLPGEELVVNIVREGKEYNQGVGYLDDGTMVVVENGKRMLSETVAVSVSSVLQTVAGKMIFAELKAEHHGEDTDENSGYYAGRGNRRKTM